MKAYQIVKKNTVRKIIHGPFVENPKCQICKIDISHEWLDGDYSLLMCDKKECWNALRDTYDR